MENTNRILRERGLSHHAPTYFSLGPTGVRKPALVLGLVICALVPLASAGSDVQGTFISFDATGADQGTYPFAINQTGVITGYYFDVNSLAHGFLRSSAGTFTQIDAPNEANGTFAVAISPASAVAGYYLDANSIGHGFVRAPNGTYATFDAPGEVNGTYPSGISPAGVTTGSYYDANNVSHGFLRGPNGTFTTFDAPGAGTSAYSGTFAGAIDPSGTVSGCYVDANSVNHGLVRSSEGTLTTFDVPGGQSTSCYTYLFPGRGAGINLNGAITGAFLEYIGGEPIWHGFERFPDGTFAAFDAANNTGCCIWTFGPSPSTPPG